MPDTADDLIGNNLQIDANEKQPLEVASDQSRGATYCGAPLASS